MAWHGWVWFATDDNNLSPGSLFGRLRMLLAGSVFGQGGKLGRGGGGRAYDMM